MKSLTLIALMFASPSFALDCTTDSECFTQGLKLIREGKKYASCLELVNASAEVLTREITNDSGRTLVKLDSCIESAKVAKTYNARVKRINQALAGK